MQLQDVGELYPPEAGPMLQQYQTGYDNKVPQITLFTHLSLSVIKSEQWKVATPGWNTHVNDSLINLHLMWNFRIAEAAV